MARLVANIGILVTFIFVGQYWADGGNIPSDARISAYLIIIISYLIIFSRGANELKPLFWFVTFAAYPILAPLLSIDLFGYSQYSSGNLRYVDVESAITTPAILGSLTTLFLAINLDPAPILTPNTDFVVARPFSVEPISLLFLFFISCAALLGATYVDAPPEILRLGQIGYSEIKALRNDAVAAASGFVIVFAAVATLTLVALRNHPRIRPGQKARLTWFFFTLVMLVTVWQILSASRVEVIGILLTLLLMFGNMVSVTVRRFYILLIGMGLSLIGYVRTLNSYSDFLRRDFLTWPGGVENVFNTYVFALNEVRAGNLEPFLGQTYIDLVVRLPPKAFGFERPPRAYDYLAENTRLIGGEYFMTEPYMNFLGVGCFAFLLLMVVLLNWTTSSIRRFYLFPTNIFPALVATTVLMFSLRLFWYGLDHMVKTMAVALIVGVPFYLAFQLIRFRLQRSSTVL